MDHLSPHEQSADERAKIAKSLLQQAQREEDIYEAQRLVEEALEAVPEMVEAWLLRAELEDDSVEAALGAYRKAAEYARQELGERFFLEEEGRFWEILESRPYMRARLGEALCLYEAKQPEEAIAVFREMLRLNPADDQGIRYTLLSIRLELGQVEKAHLLLEEYSGDTSPVWLYGRALVDFLLKGPTPAQAARERALRMWPQVAEHLAKPLPIPEDEDTLALPEISDDPDEEELCAYEMRSIWDANPAAKDWLLKGR